MISSIGAEDGATDAVGVGVAGRGALVLPVVEKMAGRMNAKETTRTAKIKVSDRSLLGITLSAALMMVMGGRDGVQFP